jgi:hypothetical protein
VDGRIDHYGRSWRRTWGPLPEGLDHPGHLVPEDVPGRELKVSDPALRVILKVGPADPHRLDAHQGLA